MKKALLLLFASIYFFGCGLANSNYFIKNYQVGVEQSATVGSVMISEESGLKNDVYNTIRNGFKFELIYAGIANNIIQVSYKEYQKTGDVFKEGSGDLIRPAFSQDLKYDISNSKIITYKEKRIEVIAANNEKITFKVLQ